jgi:hypothetical protein
MTISAGLNGVNIHKELGSWDENELDQLIREAAVIRDAGQRIRFLSDAFLGLGYKETSLTGSESSAEVFTVDLSGVDCFTFLDYIEAMRLSDSFKGFLGNLREVRYREKRISFETRRHFFTDWSTYESSVSDITEQIAGRKTEKSLKILNLKEDGTFFIPGLERCRRIVNYLPAEEIGEAELAGLKTGDYAGIYSPVQGLDVSHVGIIIRKGEGIFLRHASSDKKYWKVIDQDLQTYLEDKPGLIILRPAEKGKPGSSA